MKCINCGKEIERKESSRDPGEQSRLCPECASNFVTEIGKKDDESVVRACGSNKEIKSEHLNAQVRSWNPETKTGTLIEETDSTEPE